MDHVDPLTGMLISFGVVGVLVLLLRWAFGSGKSLVARPVRRGEPAEYGLLVSVAAPVDAPEALRLVRLLEDAGIRNTLVDTVRGPRLMVWPADEGRARALLSEPGPHG